jgi:hypothetical protein
LPTSSDYTRADRSAWWSGFSAPGRALDFDLPAQGRFDPSYDEAGICLDSRRSSNAPEKIIN